MKTKSIEKQIVNYVIMAYTDFSIIQHFRYTGICNIKLCECLSLRRKCNTTLVVFHDSMNFGAYPNVIDNLHDKFTLSKFLANYMVSNIPQFHRYTHKKFKNIFRKRPYVQVICGNHSNSLLFFLRFLSIEPEF